MNTDDDEDEWPDEPSSRTPPPGSARAAGIIWMIDGVLFVLSGCGNFLLTLLLAGERPGADVGAGSSAVWLSLGVGFGLFMSGRNVVRGKAKDVLGVALFSLAICAVYTALGVAFLAGFGGETVGLAVAAVCAVTALVCLLPAVLALAGRSQYRAWRRANPWPEDDEE